MPDINQECDEWNLTSSQCTEQIMMLGIPPSIDTTYPNDNCQRYNLTGVPLVYNTSGADLGVEVIQCDKGWMYNATSYATTIISDVSD